MVVRSIRLVLEIIAGLIAGLVILGGVLVWRLSSGPIPIDFLTPTIERALNDSDGVAEVDIGDTVITWGGWERAIDIVARDVKIRPRGGGTVALLPKISIALSVRALSRGIIAPTSLEIISPRVYLRRYADGHFSMALNARNEPVGEVADDATPLEALAAFLVPPDTSTALGYLTRISIVDAGLTFDDRQKSLLWRAPSARFTIVRDAAGITGELEGEVTVDGEAVGLHLELSRGFGEETADTTLRLDGVSGSLIRKFTEMAEGYLAPESRFTGEIRARLDAESAAPRTVELDLSSSLGRITGEATFAGDGETLVGQVEFSGIRPLQLANQGAELAMLEALDTELSGSARFSAWADGRIDALDLTLSGSAGLVALPGAKPIPFEAMQMEVGLDRKAGRGELKSLTFDLGQDAKAVITGDADFAGEDVSLAVAGELSDFAIDRLDGYWPSNLSLDARNWVTRNIPTGNVPRATISFRGRLPGGDFAALEVQDIGGEIVIRNARVDYFRPLSPATNVDALATYGIDWFDIDLAAGRVGEIELEKGLIKITELGGEDTQEYIDISLDLVTPMKPALDLLDTDPLKLVSGIGIGTEGISGDARGNVHFDFPLLNALKTSQINVVAETRVRNLVMEKGFFDRDILGADMSLRVTNDGMDVSGAVVVDGVNLDATWRENFSDAEPLKSRMTALGEVSAGNLADFGLDLGEYLVGVIQADAVIEQRRDGSQLVRVATDLEGATLGLPPMGWVKVGGQPGLLDLVIEVDPQGQMELPSFVLAAEDADVAGSATFHPDGQGLDQLSLERLELGTNSAKGSIQRQPGGHLSIQMQAERFDVAGFIDEDEEAEEEPSDLSFDLQAQVANLTAGDKRALQNVEMDLVYNRDYVRRLQLAAALNAENNVSISYLPVGDRYDLKVETDNAGAMLKSWDLLDRIEGGELVVTGSHNAPEEPLVGRIDMKDYVLTKAPIMAKVLQFMSLTGILSSFQDQGLAFSRLEADYSLQDGVLEVIKSRAFGTSIGITAKGTFGIDDEAIDIKGTVVPAYTLNRILGGIPIVGTLITGGEDEGVFGADYRVTGSVEDSQVNVNALSALAPGILRKLFVEIFPTPEGGDGGQQIPAGNQDR